VLLFASYWHLGSSLYQTPTRSTPTWVNLFTLCTIFTERQETKRNENDSHRIVLQ
jgi:hypothetical protein